MRNIEVAVKETIRCGAHASGTICYTLSPVHDIDSYIKLAKDMEAMGVHSICIKDMAGIISPKEAYDLIKALKANTTLPIILHTHSTTGLASMTLQKAAEAGVDVIDTAISCMSGGTSQAATETMNYVLTQAGFETGLDTAALKNINDFFKPVRAKALESGLLNPVVLATDTDALSYQVPGGMLSNLVAQLTAQNKMDKFEEVLQEVPKVRADLGYPPLVTPMSQMVGVQATQNVLLGKYKNVSKEVKNYVRGEYGKAPGKIDEELIKNVLGDEKPIEVRFADTLADGYEAAKAEIGAKAKSEEDVLSYIAFPAQAEAFFDKRDELERNTFRYTIREV